jgi:hypothetical protein
MTRSLPATGPDPRASSRYAVLGDKPHTSPHMPIPPRIGRTVSARTAPINGATTGSIAITEEERLPAVRLVLA